MFSILRLIILIVVLAPAAGLGYYIFYSRRINAKIAGKKVCGKRMIGIPAAICAVVIAALVLYAVSATVSIKGIEKQMSIENRNDFSVINLSDYTYSAYNDSLVDTDASYAKSYSREHNKGYQKSTSQDGDFTFTAFTRIGEHDSFHPDFFCFVDYTGQNAAGLFFYEDYKFIDTLTAKDCGGIGDGGGNVPESFLVVGNVNDGQSFNITLSILDSKGEAAYFAADDKACEKDQGNFPSAADYALVSGNAVITVQ